MRTNVPKELWLTSRTERMNGTGGLRSEEGNNSRWLTRGKTSNAYLQDVRVTCGVGCHQAHAGRARPSRRQTQKAIMQRAICGLTRALVHDG